MAPAARPQGTGLVLYSSNNVDAVEAALAEVAYFERFRANGVPALLNSLVLAACATAIVTPLAVLAAHVIVNCRGFLVSLLDAILLGRRAPDGRVLDDDLAVAAWLLEDAGVTVVPGTAFLLPNHLRFSYGASDDEIAEAVSRFAFAASRLH